MEYKPDIVRRFLREGSINPSLENNYLIEWAGRNGHIDIFYSLLMDPRVNPEDTSNEKFSALQSHEKTVRRMIEKQVKNRHIYNYTFEFACKNGFIGVVRLLMAYSKVSPGDNNNLAIMCASNSGHLEIVRLLLTDKRVDPAIGFNFPIQTACQGGYHEIVKLLLSDSRVDPSDKNNESICLALNHIEVVKLLLQDPRVDASDAKSDDPEIQELLAQWKYHPR